MSEKVGHKDRVTELRTKRTATFKRLKDSLSVTNGCFFYRSRWVIPASLQPQVLEILHLGHFGIQRMKQLTRTAVCWPGVDAAIVRMSQDCSDEPRLFVMRGAPEQTDQSTHSPVDGAGETLQPNSCGSCHKFHGFELVSGRGRLLQVSVCSPHDLYTVPPPRQPWICWSRILRISVIPTPSLPTMPPLLPPRNFKSGVDAEELRTSREHHTTLKLMEQRNGWFSP